MKHPISPTRRRARLMAALFCAIAPLVAAEPEAGFQSLFNGKDLSGWEGNPAIWSVRDGTISGETKADPKLTHNTFLVYTNGGFGDFELRLSYRIMAGNSGVQYRSRRLEPGEWGPIITGYQADIEAGKNHTAILYEEKGRGILAKRGQKVVIPEAEGKPKPEVVGALGDAAELQTKIKDKDWNDYVIIAKGNHLQHFVNGAQMIDVIDNQASKAAKEGLLALQVHVGPPMTVHFRDVRIKKLP